MYVYIHIYECNCVELLVHHRIVSYATQMMDVFGKKRKLNKDNNI